MKKLISTMLIFALTILLTSTSIEHFTAEQVDYNISDRLFVKKQHRRKIHNG